MPGKAAPLLRAAGILFLTPDRKALFLKRGDGGDHPGEWCWPGGHQEGDETTEECAVREATEEAGEVPTGERILLTRSVTPTPIAAPPPAAMPAGAEAAALPEVPAPVDAPEQVDFTTFLQQVKVPFVPTLCDEHTGHAWADVGAPPEPLHPGCRTAIARLSADELGVARMMAAGELSSPQRYHNVSLFAMRITGTGVAYRSALDEFVWRDPGVYMNEEFLARCNGLPVIWEHPKKTLLNSDEFADRVVGSILLPYLRPEAGEVWGIAKVYDDEAVEAMQEQLSTSPAVHFGVLSVNTKMTLEDGSTLLIEGKPSLLDHLAICSVGVWDKGGEPSGIDIGAVADSEPPVITSCHRDRGLDPEKLRLLEQGVILLGARASNLLSRRTTHH